MNMTDDSLFGYHDLEATYLVILPIAIPSVALDLFTLFILLTSKRLRKLVNYPVISFMFAALIQDVLAMPLYLYRYLHTKFDGQHAWVCSTYRFSYFFSGHTLKMSLLVVSFERLCSIKYPLKYRKLLRQKNMFFILLCIWIFIAFVDIMPFYLNRGVSKNGCSYVPFQKWGISVISIFNTIPFILITINYFIIWKIAFRKGFHDRKLRDSINSIPSTVVVTQPNQNTIPMHTPPVKTRKKIRSVDDYVPPHEQHEMVEFIGRKLKNSLTKTPSKTSAVMFALELKATRIALAFLFSYLMCWSPMAIFYFIDNVTQNHLTRSSDRSLIIARFVVKIVGFSSSFFVPLVYIWRSQLFRKEIQRKCFPKKFRQKRQLSATKYSIPKTFSLKHKLLS